MEGGIKARGRVLADERGKGRETEGGKEGSAACYETRGQWYCPASFAKKETRQKES